MRVSLRRWVALTALGALHGACGSEALRGSGDEDGAGGHGGAGPAPSASGPSSATASTSVGSGGQGGGSGSSTSSSTTSVSSGGSPECFGGELFGPDAVACNQCVDDQCCDEVTACLDDFDAGGDACLLQDGSGMFNREGALGIALLGCLDAGCCRECGAGDCGCQLVVSTGDAELDACISTNCCELAVACFGADGETLEDCNACLVAGGGALCDTYIACFDANCASPGVCGTDLAPEDPNLNACINESCCAPFLECFGADGETLEDCNACLEAGGGTPCDGYLECVTDNCSVE